MAIAISFFLSWWLNYLPKPSWSSFLQTNRLVHCPIAPGHMPLCWWFLPSHPRQWNVTIVTWVLLLVFVFSSTHAWCKPFPRWFVRVNLRTSPSTCHTGEQSFIFAHLLLFSIHSRFENVFWSFRLVISPYLPVSLLLSLPLLLLASFLEAWFGLFFWYMFRLLE